MRATSNCLRCGVQVGANYQTQRVLCGGCRKSAKLKRQRNHYARNRVPVCNLSYTCQRCTARINGENSRKYCRLCKVAVHREWRNRVPDPAPDFLYTLDQHLRYIRIALCGPSCAVPVDLLMR